MTGKEVLAKLKELEEHGVLSESDFVESGLDDVEDSMQYVHLDDMDTADVLGILEELGETEQVEYNSPNSEWEYYTRTVTRFPKHDVYIETKGHYTSYVGTEYEDGFGTVVRPVQKMFTVYEGVN